MTTSQAQCETNCPPPTPASDANRCLFITSDGRQCRLTRSPRHDALCAPHARKEEREARSQFAGGLTPELAAELAPLSGSFRTANDVNRMLGKLFLLVAQGRIARRDAMALGYLAQLLIQTLPATQRETRDALGFPHWCEIVRSAIPNDEEEEDAEEEDESAAAQATDSDEAQNVDGSIRSSGSPVQLHGTGNLRPLPHAAVVEPATAEWSELAEPCDAEVVLTFPEFTVMDQRNSLLLAQSRAQAANAAKAADAATDTQAQSVADQARAEFMNILLAAAHNDAPDCAGSVSTVQSAKPSPGPSTGEEQRNTPPNTQASAVAQPPQPAPQQPAPEPKPEPLCTLRIPGLNGTMQEMQVTVASREAAFAPRLPWANPRR